MAAEAGSLREQVPHLKSILYFGLGALILGVVLLTWVYPAYCELYCQVKEQKTSDYIEDTWGISPDAMPVGDSDDQAAGEARPDVGAPGIQENSPEPAPGPEPPV
jgi:hypothetical protein